MSKLTNRLNKKNHTSHIALHTSNKGITLIALIITIIVMLILTGVTLSITLGDNGLVNKAKEATEATQVAMDRELLLSAIVGAMGNDGKVNLSAINLPAGFTGSNGTYTSENGYTFTIDENGQIAYVGGDEEKEEIGTVDLNGRYYFDINDTDNYLEIRNHNKFIEVWYYYDDSSGELKSGEFEYNLLMEINEEKNSGIMTLTWEEHDLDFNYYNETDIYNEEEILFTYAIIKESNQIINKVMMYGNELFLFQNMNGISFPLNGSYLSEDGNHKYVFEEESSYIDYYYKSGDNWYAPTFSDYYDLCSYCKAGDTYLFGSYNETIIQFSADENSFIYNGITFTKINE